MVSRVPTAKFAGVKVSLRIQGGIDEVDDSQVTKTRFKKLGDFVVIRSVHAGREIIRKGDGDVKIALPYAVLLQLPRQRAVRISLRCRTLHANQHYARRGPVDRGADRTSARAFSLLEIRALAVLCAAVPV